MKSEDKTKEQLLEEIAMLKMEICDLKKSELERKEIEEALAQQHNLYLDLSNTQPAGIYRLCVYATKNLAEENRHNSKDSPYIFEFTNSRFCEILKMSMQDIQSKPGMVLDLVYEPDKADFAKKNVEANLNTTPFLWEGRFFIEEEIHWMHLESLPRVLEGGDTIWTGILYDITEHKNAQQEIALKNEQLLTLNAEKDKFFSIIAHDLRSPFSSFLGLTQIMAEKLPDLTMAQLQTIAVSMRNSATNLFRLLENLLQWSKVQQGLTLFKPEVIQLRAIIEESLAMMREPAKIKGIEIVCEIQVEIQVFADKNMLQTVIRNLISNAVKFTPKGGKITISAKLIGVKNVEISIIDTGIGMSTTIVDSLFKIDMQTNRKGTEDEPSAGLGLLLCKEFVEKHGSKILVESKEGVSSKFYFTLAMSNMS